MAAVLEGTRMAGGSEQGLHTFFLPRKSTESIDEDPNQQRRKRQRTASPHPKPAISSENAWYNQLKAAADGLPPATSSTNASAFKDGLSEGANKKERSRAPKPNAEVKSPGQPRRVSQSAGNVLSTPPKKMLKIRSDGKLSSPKSQNSVPDAKPKRKRATSKSVDGVKKRVVIVKYGVDNARRVSVGDRIHNILSGQGKAPKKERSPRKPPKQVCRSKPVSPSKPTHPFFLSKPSSDLGQKEGEQKRSPTEASTQKEVSRNDAPRKITSVNKLIRRRSLTGMDGFGDQPPGPSFQKVPRLAGAREALWPPKHMVHVMPPTEKAQNQTPMTSRSSTLRRSRKLKNASVQVQESEDVLFPYRLLVQPKGAENLDYTLLGRTLRKPLRKIMTGRELQSTVSHIISRKPSEDELKRDSQDECVVFKHQALENLYSMIAQSTTAFDNFAYETHDWVHKYAPKTAEDVLQQGHEATVLRDWLKDLTINSVENRGLNASKKFGAHPKKKRRKAGLDGFVISSDEEVDQLNEMTTGNDLQLHGRGDNSLKRTVIRTSDLAKASHDLKTSANAVVISGPHGCGKTAAVYAVAHQLGFEVFEINSGSRRSGKDLLDKVGDMTRNHLVSHKREEQNKESSKDTEDDETLRVTDSFEKDLESGRQGTMKSFFQPKLNIKSKAAAKPRGRPKKEVPDKKPSPIIPKPQKQSLILLEEVDVLFEEDKQFWTTVFDLLLRSRRPVIMTCTNESLVPIEEMLLFAILRFSPPPITIATDYLLLMACNEGHLLSFDAVYALYRSKNKDLRASITELNFYCQMAIGDAKGGLEWLLIRSSPKESRNEKGESLRVISDGTYPRGIGWLSQDHEPRKAGNSLETESELLAETWDGWGVDLAECNDFLPFENLDDGVESMQERNLRRLQNLDQACNALSAADICSTLGLGQNETVLLDPTQPEMLEKARPNYAEGAVLLQADARTDNTGTSASLAVTIRSLARHSTASCAPLTPASIVHQIPILLEKPHKLTSTRVADMLTAFAPLSTAFPVSSFTGPTSILAVDVTPYIRSITSYDLRLEEQRRKLDDLLSASQTGAADARSGKRIRTTRASRAALEGGAKATTRRERWFPNTLDFAAVARTGGKDWGEIAFNRTQALESGREAQDSGRRMSSGSWKSNERRMSTASGRSVEDAIQV